MIGTTLSHYRILEELSRGGMGVVYRALDVRLNREIAIKTLAPELVSDPDRKSRFLQEARAGAALKHPNVGVGKDIWSLPLDTGEVRALTHLGSRPGSPGTHGLATDGRFLYFTWVEELGDLWQAELVIG